MSDGEVHSTNHFFIGERLESQITLPPAVASRTETRRLITGSFSVGYCSGGFAHHASYDVLNSTRSEEGAPVMMNRMFYGHT